MTKRRLACLPREDTKMLLNEEAGPMTFARLRETQDGLFDEDSRFPHTQILKLFLWCPREYKSLSRIFPQVKFNSLLLFCAKPITLLSTFPTEETLQNHLCIVLMIRRALVGSF